MKKKVVETIKNNLDKSAKSNSAKTTSLKSKMLSFSTKHLKLNFFFGLILFIVFLVNAYIISQYTVYKNSPTKAFSNFAQNSLEVVDTIWEPSLKQTDGYTGALIMGIDSRNLQFDGQSFLGKDRDIDSIIQIVINNETGEIFMFGIPRDTGITIEEECAGQDKLYFKSINHAYKLGEDGGCPGGGAKLMSDYVTYVTGFENHYFAVISYDAFKDIINTVGDTKDGQKGLYIDVPRNITEYYPREVGGGFERVYFSKGRQFIVTDDLLKYARSRKATSDFDRAARQQQVLEALQAKLLSSEVLSDPTKIFELYETFSNKALFSQVTLDDIRGAISLAKKVDTDKVCKFVLDDYFGGLNALITRPTYSGKGTHNRYGYYLSPVHFNDPECIEREDEYCKLKDYLQMVYNNPEGFAEEPVIYAYSNVKGREVTNEAFEKGKEAYELPILVSKYALPGRDDWGDVQIYDFSDGEKPMTKKRLEEAFSVEIRDGSMAPFKRINEESFAIIVKTN